jgi:hypothetical protein
VNGTAPSVVTRPALRNGVVAAKTGDTKRIEKRRRKKTAARLLAKSPIDQP